MSHALGMAIGGVVGVVLLLVFRWIKDRVYAYKELRSDVSMLEWKVDNRTVDICQCKTEIRALKAKLEEMGDSHD